MKLILLTILFLPLSLAAQQKELYPKVVLLNSKLECSGRMTDSAVHASLGWPDSTVRSIANCGTFFDTEDSIAYYKTVALEKNKDTFALSFIEFSAISPTFVQFGRVKLNGSTTIEDVTSVYNVFGNLATNEINDERSGRQVRILGIYMNANDPVSGYDLERWNLIFYHGKLIRFELWIAC